MRDSRWEAGAQARVALTGRVDDLQRDHPLKLGLACEIHHAHASPTQQALDDEIPTVAPGANTMAKS